MNKSNINKKNKKIIRIKTKQMKSKIKLILFNPR